MPTKKDTYKKICQTESVPIFSQYWWLDSVVGQEWDVALAEDKGGNVIGSMPFLLKKKYGFSVSGMPPLTQKIGPFIKYPEGQKYEAKLSHEKKVMDQLIDSLPRLDRFHQKWDFNYSNWLPFYWKGFSQSTRYTYVIDLSLSHESLFADYRGNIRREIKKANKHVAIDLDTPLKTLYEMHLKTFKRQGSKPAYSFQLLEQIDEKVREESERMIISACDDQHRVHTALYLLLDQKARCAYYLIGGGDPELRNSGATSLIMDEAIKQSRKKGMDLFDFEGSMIEPIEMFFRGFASRQKPYFEISKYANKWLQCFDLLKN
ncbi:GNAT family N-acetyltransferase [Ekhidna sp. MALMAid0563]|uniref:GNAT family N-acetyltransferase n=1 Tax=Ekhidna sp. MALMAid0563 TaxID=3143937 RepID=UPI0032DF6803